MPPLAVLAQWEDIYRAWLSHDPRASRRASVHGAIGYLKQQLPYIANHLGPTAPDFLAFSRQIRDLRADLETRLHDEDTLEEGVPCFECGEKLVRRIRERRQCKHTTPARQHLALRMTLLPHARKLIADLALARTAYANRSDRDAPRPSMARFPTAAEYAATLPPTPVELTAARIACAACSQNGLGGIDDPTAGHSWECPGCRKDYKPGEYVTAVRLDLTDRDGWPTIPNAAAAATTLTEWPIGDKTIRSWIGREWVRSDLQIRENGLPGMRLVYWPDVRREARRVAAGMQHCRHETPARVWLKVLQSYPEIEVWEDEVEATWEECNACFEEVDRRLGAGVRRAVGRAVS